jgi:hypothetical protein
MRRQGRRPRPPSRALADALNGRSRAALELGQIPEMAEDARRSLAITREVGYPVGQALALMCLATAAAAADDLGEGVRLLRQADQAFDASSTTPIPAVSPPTESRRRQLWCRIPATASDASAAGFRRR